MIINSINSSRYANFFTCKNISYPSFKGQLEDRFWEDTHDGNIQGQIKCISNIKFDIYEKDIQNGDNFLHAVFKSKNNQLINKALILLGQRINSNREQTISLLSDVNNENKTPAEYITDSTTISRLQRLTGKSIKGLTQESIKTVPNIPAQETKNKLNELPSGTKLQIPDIDEDFDDEDTIETNIVQQDFSNIKQIETFVPLEEAAGAQKAKKLLLDKIVNPMKEGQQVKDSGFLLYGNTGCGKSFLLNSLAKSLNKEIINSRKFEEMLNSEAKSDSDLQTIFDNYIVQVEDVQQLETVIDCAKENYRNNQKQAVIYIDEIKGILPDVNAAVSNSVTKAEQLIENSASKGIILVATTRDKNSLSVDSIRAGRFDNHIELKLPDQKEREELLNKYNTHENIQTANIDLILKKTTGFSYVDMFKTIERLNVLKTLNTNNIDSTIQNYARENNLGEISENGTTYNYDTVIKRERIKHPANFSEAAGMEDVKTKFKKLLIDRLKPEALERFKKNGSRAPIKSGFLLYGSPGTGKTYIVESLAGEMNIPLYKLDSSRFEDKYVGETEKNLKKIFDQLETKFKETGEYSILFIDEADSILSNRENSGEYKSGIVNQLLQYINNSAQRGIITITATNYKDKIDKAVLSRLGEQIAVSQPDIESIKSIIDLAIKNLKIADNISNDDIAEIAARLNGFSARDIDTILSNTIDTQLSYTDEQLTVEDFKREINNFAITHELPEINDRNKTSSYDTFIKRLKISSDDPQNLDDLGGMKDVKEKLLQVVGFDMLNPDIVERYKLNKVKEQGGALLYGEPGCGKTYIMKALASHLGLPIYEYKLSEQGSSYLHQTTSNIGKIFNQLKEKYEKTGEKSILMIDEFEDVSPRRDTSLNEHKQEETDALLKEIQNARQNGIIVVAATNYYDKVDDAMKRPGRFKAIEVPLPDFDSRKDIIKKSLQGREIVQGISNNDDTINKLAQCSDGFSIVDITETINLLIKTSIDNRVDKLTENDLKNAFNERTLEKAKEKRKVSN